MHHISSLKTLGVQDEARIYTTATGRFFTGEFVVHTLAASLENDLSSRALQGGQVTLIDPFGGDGRLPLEAIKRLPREISSKCAWKVTLMDLNGDSFDEAHRTFDSLAQDIDVSLKTIECDTFASLLSNNELYDVVITNPPWESLKPDRRELTDLDEARHSDYIASLRKYDEFLALNYPYSQPRNKFAGWGTNLSRVGLEASISCLAKRGTLAIVLPASIMADEQSAQLRSYMFSRLNLSEIRYYPAESKLFGSADVDSVTLIGTNSPATQVEIPVFQFSPDLKTFRETHYKASFDTIAKRGYSIPVAYSSDIEPVIDRLSTTHPTWGELEKDYIWAGREVDETGSSDWPENGTSPNFVRGRMIGRFEHLAKPTQTVPPAKIKCTWCNNCSEKIVWRDISRPSQKRRLIASVIPGHWIAGNSLGVAYLKRSDPKRLRALLLVMSSTVFETQLRRHLATGHVSLGSLRKVRIPDLFVSTVDEHRLLDHEHISNPSDEGDAFVAKVLYGLTRDEYVLILSTFPKLTSSELSNHLACFDQIKVQPLVGRRRISLQLELV
jgi:Alw26I/Eco31I/Esp3I family type II restriction m6 adenine DNA methyltransferase